MLYASGSPFIIVSSAVRPPITRPALPRTSSAISGFFFWGIMLEPVEKASSSSINLNSQEHQRMISSEKRERWTMVIATAAASSMQKSRSETPSRLLCVGPSNLSSEAVMSRFSG